MENQPGKSNNFDKILKNDEVMNRIVPDDVFSETIHLTGIEISDLERKISDIDKQIEKVYSLDYRGDEITKENILIDLENQKRFYENKLSKTYEKIEKTKDLQKFDGYEYKK